MAFLVHMKNDHVGGIETALHAVSFAHVKNFLGTVFRELYIVMFLAHGENLRHPHNGAASFVCGENLPNFIPIIAQVAASPAYGKSPPRDAVHFPSQRFPLH